MALQLRSKSVSFCPGFWSTSVGGHVQSGEDYLKGALREFEEELGVKTELEFISKEKYIDKNDYGEKIEKFLGIFKTIYEGPFKIFPEEVERIEYFAIDEIKKMYEKGDKFHPELIFILKKYFFNN